MFTCELQDSQEALTGSHAMGLDELIHPPGCSDPNCLLPSCINIKLRRNHLQTCRKKKGRCDICKILTSNLSTDALVSPLPSPPVKPQRKKAREAAATQADVSITTDVAAGKKQEKITPESPFHSLRKEITSFDAVEESPAPRQQGLSMAVLPYVDRAGSFQHHGQNTVQLSTSLNDGDCTPTQGRQDQVIQSPLEVLCNALQTLNTVIQMVTSNQLEMHAIPIFRQALAGMELTVFKRFEGNIGASSLDNPMTMDYFENGTSKVENQWATSSVAAAIPMLPSSSLPTSYSLPSSASSRPPLSASSSSSLSSSLSSSPPLTPPSYDDVPPGANQWAECFKFQDPSKPMLTNSDPTVDVYGDQLGESSFNLQDILLLDFAEELLG